MRLEELDYKYLNSIDGLIQPGAEKAKLERVFLHLKDQYPDFSTELLGHAIINFHKLRACPKNLVGSKTKSHGTKDKIATKISQIRSHIDQVGELLNEELSDHVAYELYPRAHQRNLLSHISKYLDEFEETRGIDGNPKPIAELENEFVRPLKENIKHQSLTEFVQQLGDLFLSESVQSTMNSNIFSTERADVEKLLERVRNRMRKSR